MPATYSAHLVAGGALVLLVLVIVLGILARFALLVAGLQGLGWWAAGYVHTDTVGILRTYVCLYLDAENRRLLYVVMRASYGRCGQVIVLNKSV